MALLNKKLIITLLLTTAFLFTGCTKDKNCFLCNGNGKLSCAVCIDIISNKENCEFCDGNGQSICSLCNGNGIEKK
tara:strand:- start:304 stop:531 length:228 start_codon:yes stop_codon:yes gene_type:complete